jgi:hypothetical protein
MSWSMGQQYFLQKYDRYLNKHWKYSIGKPESLFVKHLHGQEQYEYVKDQENTSGYLWC